jgi:hypothetical protein
MSQLDVGGELKNRAWNRAIEDHNRAQFCNSPPTSNLMHTACLLCSRIFITEISNQTVCTRSDPGGEVKKLI